MVTQNKKRAPRTTGKKGKKGKRPSVQPPSPAQRWYEIYERIATEMPPDRTIGVATWQDFYSRGPYWKHRDSATNAAPSSQEVAGQQLEKEDGNEGS